MIIVILVVMLTSMLEINKSAGNCATLGFAIDGVVRGNGVYVRKTASRTGENLLYRGMNVKLRKDVVVIINGQRMTKGEKWYRISFQYEQKTLTGYMLSNYIQLSLKEPVKAKVSSKTAVKLRTVAGGRTYVKVEHQTVALPKDKAVKILKEDTTSGQKWFYISSTYRVKSRTKTCKGYVPAEVISFTTTEKNQSSTPDITVQPSSSKTPAITPNPSYAGKKGTVIASALNVRTGAGTNYGVLVWNSWKVQIVYGTRVLIWDSEKVNNTDWYKVSFVYQDMTLFGYVSGKYIQIGDVPIISSPVPSKVPEGKPTIAPSKKPSSSDLQVPLSDAQFEEALEEQRFPEDYKKGLRILHQKYPLWQFKAYHTGINWTTAIKNESAVGKNLISKAKASGWKSYEKGAYNWSTDTCIPFDGSTWVTASKEAIEYYMDPRNFLTTDGIFQFEYLAYAPEYQKEQGVESILKNTVLSNKIYTYNENEEEIRKTYGETFMDAADYSSVNPFHLATRVKQEVVKSTGLSASASGNLAPYVGYYNFYNIGAYHSTAANGAVKNGLHFAKNGGSMSAANKAACLIPWNNQYKAIVGGAKYIGTNYINRGQNTVYLQKFNVSSNSTFNHQYMANVEAAKSEAQRTFTAYKTFTDIPIVFFIPVYNNMRAEKAPVPGNKSNPNNWLKSLSVTDAINLECTMTPTFNISNGESTTYTIMVDSETTSVKINAKSVSPFASIVGDGIKNLNEGTNTFKIKVTAQNGNVRTYILYVIKA